MSDESNTQTTSTQPGLDKGLSNVSKESSMSIPGAVDLSRSQSNLDENIFDDAKRALAPSGGGGFGGTNGAIKHISPHMVNIHQFYPEIDFSLDKGTVGEIVVTPKSTSRSDMGKRSAIDLKDAVIEEESETESQSQPYSAGKPEETPFDARSESDFVTESSMSLDIGGIHRKTRARKYDSDDDDEGVFSTQVDEDTIKVAKERRKKNGLFNPETWGPSESKTWTLDSIVSDKADSHFKAGCEAVEQKAYEKSITHFNKAINLQPKVMDYYIHRAEAFLHLCDFQSTILNYKKACVLDPDNTDLYNRLAFIYYFQGQCLFDQKLFPEALEAFSRAAEMRPEVEGYHTRSIACLAALQRHGECLALVNKRLEAEEDNPDLYVMRARLHQLFRNTTLCYYDVKDAMMIDPTHTEACRLMDELEGKAEDYRNQANNLNLMGRHRDALQKISIAIETNPSVPEFHVLRGSLHRRTGDYNSAIDDYLLALDKTDHDEDHPAYRESQRQLLLTYNDFAVECFVKGFFEEAIILLNKAIKGEKREKGLYVNRGDCFFKEDNLEFALADYHQALELDEVDAVVRARIAIIHNEYGIKDYQQKRYKDAESRFTIALQHNPKSAKYYLSRARARHLLNDMNGCRLDILMSVHLDPANPEIPTLIARFFQGKSMKDILSSKLADTARHQLQNLTVKLNPLSVILLKKLDEINEKKRGLSVKVASKLSDATTGSPSGRNTRVSQKEEVDLDGDLDEQEEEVQEVEGATAMVEDYTPPVADRWKPGLNFPNLKTCMEEKEFHIKVAEEKKQINSRVKDALNNRRPLSYTGARVGKMPDSSSIPTAATSKFMVKPPHKKKSTGWRNFSLGISGGAS